MTAAPLVATTAGVLGYAALAFVIGLTCGLIVALGIWRWPADRPAAKEAPTDWSRP